MSVRLLQLLYVAVMLASSALSLHALVLSSLYLYHRRRSPPEPDAPVEWPTVTVQLPLYNEKHIVERLIDAVCALDYPAGRLSIQLLDDSTDLTTELARRCVEAQRDRGVDIQLIHRQHRDGYKAGALRNGLSTARGELIAVLDADFVPGRDFLKKLVPYLVANPSLGMVQARWDHLNPGENWITRGQALSLDTHFVVFQTARCRSGLLFSFNGSGGIWRRVCIEDAGGWKGGNLTEDLDLSYRAQLKGWRMLYLKDVTVGAQIPGDILAYRQQQFRWAYGGIQTLLALKTDIRRSNLSLGQKAAAYLHLGSYLAHPLMVFLILLCLPILVSRNPELPSLWWMFPASLGPPFLVIISQWQVYPDWKRRLVYLPIQIFLSVGMAFNNTIAILRAVFRLSTPFARTPKFNLFAPQPDRFRNAYHIRLPWTVWGETAFSLYALALALLARQRLPELFGPLVLAGASLGFVAGVALLQTFSLWRLSTLPGEASRPVTKSIQATHKTGG